jgi:hypothetical protein
MLANHRKSGDACDEGDAGSDGAPPEKASLLCRNIPGIRVPGRVLCPPPRKPSCGRAIDARRKRADAGSRVRSALRHRSLLLHGAE